MTMLQSPKTQRTGPSGEGGPHARTSRPFSRSGKNGRPWACGGRRTSHLWVAGQWLPQTLPWGQERRLWPQVP